MAEVNFKCPKTGKEFYHAVHRSVLVDGERVYKDNQGKVLINPDNNEPLVWIEREFKGMPNIGKFSALSPHQKKKVLKNLERFIVGSPRNILKETSVFKIVGRSK